MQKLIEEYRRSLRLLRTAKVVPMGFNSMISDTIFAIEMMETGRIPGAKWTVARWAKVDREIPVDPQVMARSFHPRVPSEPVPDQVHDLLETLLKALTERERDAYRLVRGELFSFAQAGQIMGCSKGSIQNFVARAERKIQLVIRKQAISKEDSLGLIHVNI